MHRRSRSEGVPDRRCRRSAVEIPSKSPATASHRTCFRRRARTNAALASTAKLTNGTSVMEVTLSMEKTGWIARTALPTTACVRATWSSLSRRDRPQRPVTASTIVDTRKATNENPNGPGHLGQVHVRGQVENLPEATRQRSGTERWPPCSTTGLPSASCTARSIRTAIRRPRSRATITPRLSHRIAGPR